MNISARVVLGDFHVIYFQNKICFEAFGLNGPHICLDVERKFKFNVKTNDEVRLTQIHTSKQILFWKKIEFGIDV